MNSIYLSTFLSLVVVSGVNAACIPKTDSDWKARGCVVEYPNATDTSGLGTVAINYALNVDSCNIQCLNNKWITQQTCRTGYEKSNCTICPTCVPKQCPRKSDAEWKALGCTVQNPNGTTVPALGVVTANGELNVGSCNITCEDNYWDIEHTCVSGYEKSNCEICDLCLGLHVCESKTDAEWKANGCIVESPSATTVNGLGTLSANAELGFGLCDIRCVNNNWVIDQTCKVGYRESNSTDGLPMCVYKPKIALNKSECLAAKTSLSSIEGAGGTPFFDQHTYEWMPYGCVYYNKNNDGWQRILWNADTTNNDGGPSSHFSHRVYLEEGVYIYDRGWDGPLYSTVTVEYNGGEYQVCENDVVKVIWNGNHNIQEVDFNGWGQSYASNFTIGDATHGFESNGHEQLVSGLSASPGKTRYFVCTIHPATAKFATFCPALPTTTTTEAPSCAGNSCIDNSKRISIGMDKQETDDMVADFAKPVAEGAKITITKSIKEISDLIPLEERKKILNLRMKVATKMIFASNPTVEKVVIDVASIPTTVFATNSIKTNIIEEVLVLKTSVKHKLKKISQVKPLYSPMEPGEKMELEIKGQEFAFNATSNGTIVTWPNGTTTTVLTSQTVSGYGYLITSGSVAIQADTSEGCEDIVNNSTRTCAQILDDYNSNGCCGAAPGNCSIDMEEYNCKGCCS